MRMRTYILASIAPVLALTSCGSSANTGDGADTSSPGDTDASSSGSADGASSSETGASGDGDGSSGLITIPDASTGGNGQCSAYKSCADLGYDCGTVPDGCGNVQDCGTCTAPAVCGGGGDQNVCGTPACSPKTCAEQGFDCGQATDGCGGTIDCGTCGADQTCGADSANRCGSGGCTPKTCADQGYQCGTQGDGCGKVIDCGSCAAGQACGGGANPRAGVCGVIDTCVPKTCADQGFDCGQATDGCGKVLTCGNGGGCPAGQVCGGGGANLCGDDTCTAGTNLVYVWGTDNNIYSFDPPSKKFTKIATPDCKASTPNSMAIDRNLVAWLNYASPPLLSSYIFKFDLKTKKGCTSSGITLPLGVGRVGMGFSSDTPGSKAETLYVSSLSDGTLYKVDMAKKNTVRLGNYSNDAKLKSKNAELTGTGNALLYGYFTTSPNVRLAQIDKANGNVLSDAELKGFPPPSSWAFSFWGGNFYMYTATSGNSKVVQYNPNTKALDLGYVANAGFKIIGAGVSTCAPTCTPRTCAQASAQCGPASDGCGRILDCGSCKQGQACVAGACTTGCTPKSCAAQGFTCGMQGDGCGGAIDCTSCAGGKSCNAGTCSTASCTPKTCATLGYACGSVGDGCGHILDCGDCPSGSVCGGQTPGQCYQPPCTPKTCAQLGYNCGKATDGCGKIIDCGACTGSQTCGGGGVANVCGGGGIK